MKEYLDFFGEPFKLNYNGKYLFKTNLSTAFSVLTLLTSGFWGVWNLYLMFTHNGLVINSYQTNLSKDDYYTFGEDKYFAIKMTDSMGVDLLDNNSNFLDYITYSSKFVGVGNYTNELFISYCNSTYSQSLPNYTNLLCLNFNNSQLGGNFFSAFQEKSYIEMALFFDYSMFIKDINANSSIINFTFPINIYIFSPKAILNLNNYDQPTIYEAGVVSSQLYYNQSKYLQLQSDVIQISSDLSPVLNSKSSLNITSFSGLYYSEQIYLENTLLYLKFYLAPIKTIYHRSYMNLQNVFNNVNSVASFFFTIFGFMCRKYNTYKLKKEFIEENILFRLDKESSINENFNIFVDSKINQKPLQSKLQLNEISNSPVEEIKFDTSEIFQEINKMKTISNRRHCKIIQMKSFFDIVLCCKHKDTIRNQIYSNDAEDFY